MKNSLQPHGPLQLSATRCRRHQEGAGLCGLTREKHQVVAQQPHLVHHRRRISASLPWLEGRRTVDRWKCSPEPGCRLLARTTVNQTKQATLGQAHREAPQRTGDRTHRRQSCWERWRRHRHNSNRTSNAHTHLKHPRPHLQQGERRHGATIAQSKIRFSPGVIGGEGKDSTSTAPPTGKAAPMDVAAARSERI
jgi:hypothetical protein